MGGNANCPVPTFPIVNSTTNLDGVDRLPMVNAMMQQKISPCLTQVMRMTCIKATEVCSSDQRYLVAKVTQEDCMEYLRCLPEGQFPEGFKIQACENQPAATGATTVAGPVFEIVPQQKQIESASECLKQSSFIIAAILAFAYMQL
ncbi:Hypothetical predicted protein [Paramuricea clavata]|uniref:Uncharacterized protein n=1 Tax=Paramuricea clavata TaxID=317549 RepID=A0A7D9DJX9_PARCT|nr:Hypothetical predicted protein [Paramuricea clavata]